jgi:hypothetical protein
MEGTVVAKRLGCRVPAPKESSKARGLAVFDARHIEVF